MRWCWICTFALVLAPLCRSAAAQSAREPVPIWILPLDELHQDGGDAAARGLGTLFADLLSQALSSTSECAVVDRGVLAEVLAENAWGPRPAHELLRARWVLHGTVMQRGPELFLTVHVTDVETTRILGSARAAGPRTAPGRLVQPLTDQLVRLARVTRSVGGSAASDPAPTANLHFLRGLHHYHAGQYHRALAEFLHIRSPPAAAARGALWRAKCYVATQHHGHAFLELLELQRAPATELSLKVLQSLLDECTRHLSPAEVETYRAL